jgi:hypothetical protein
MPVERREIRLSNDEVMAAVSAYARLTPGILPSGKLQNVLVAVSAARPCVTASVALVGDPSGPLVAVSISYESIVELVIRFCQEEGIPMPRGGSKHASIMDGLLTLVIDHGGAGRG